MKKTIMAFVLMGILTVSTGCVGFDLGDLNGLFNPDSAQNSSPNGFTCAIEHTDENANGVCDDCQASTLRTFDIFGLNDLHGKLADTDEQPGVDELTTYLKQAQAANENTILLSSGDMWQGSSESNLTKGLIMTDWMNELGFVSMTLGNHEYDWGESYIEQNLEAAEFPFLAINIYDRATNQRVEYCDASVMVEKNGAKIGIIGAMGDCYSSIAQDKVEDVYFKTGRELTALVKAEADRLKAQGADCIVYSIHDEGEYDESLSNGYVDIVFEGHTHQLYTTTDRYGVYHLQNGGDNNGGISKATLKINIATEDARVTNATVIRSNVYRNMADDPIVETLLKKYEKEISLGGKTLGRNDAYRSGETLSQLVAKLYYQAGVEKWGEEYDIVLGGGNINVRSPYHLEAGDVTYGDLQMLFPFDNQLVLCSIQGKDLKSRFYEDIPNNYYLAYSEAFTGDIEENATYYIVTDTWNSPYAANRLTEVARYDETTFARDLLAKHIEEGGLTESEEVNLTPISEILELGNALSDNEETIAQYAVKGTVISIDNTTWGNMTIEDEDGNTLYIYGTYDQYGETRYDKMENPPKVGDQVVLRGVIKKYVNDNGVKIEIINAKTLLLNEEIENV